MPAQMGLIPISAIIGAGVSLSAQVDIGPGQLVGMLIPAGWTAASITFQASPDGGQTFGNLFSAAGVEQTLTVAAGQFIAIDPTLWKGVRSIKIRSGTSAAPVNQAAQANLTLVTQL